MPLAWRPARLPPDQRQDSAVTYVAICVVRAIAWGKALDGSNAVTHQSRSNQNGIL
ncbi:hypothetical protein GIW45_10460 [Pseudomonas congelans]|nr:hypothetical protein [Pseudomonas congelans]